MDQRENLFQHFLGELPSTSETPHPCGDADAEEVSDEPEYDPASELDLEEDVMSGNDDELVEEDDEDVNLTTLQPVAGSFFIHQASRGSASATAGQESEAMPNETPGEETNGCEALLNINQDHGTDNDSLVTPNGEDIHGLSTAKDGTVWSKTAPPPTRTSASNIFRPPPKQVVNSRSLFSVGQTFKRFINAKMVERIVTCTNKEGGRVRGNSWNKTDSVEIEAFIGCLLQMGALHNNESSTPIVWHKVDGNHMVQACFSRHRFLRLSNHLRFDDKETRSARRARDNFAPFCEIWDDLNTNLGREYLPGPCLTVDEQLMP
ncbi:Piggybac transposable element-derived protein 4-like protein [Elysia marginata]|uniref:Piggybac transposable element-derived protein 4-like protein n=1 Tax=Elysia marginata TaxID=1093978 RepID=A0AAV4F1Q3_9GAST|nr:Piggybac transposable element-derived protein 4-like protein [Elysia marginata]